MECSIFCSGKAQQCGFHAVVPAEVHVGIDLWVFSVAKTVGGMVTKAVGIFRGEGCLHLLFYFCLWEEVLAQGDPS